ncbi:MAG: lactate 2-monooxygenase [Bacteroidota bacterium]
MPEAFNALDRQKNIYISGLSGKLPTIPTDLNHLEAAAKKVMDPKAYAYIAGGAGNELTIERNRSAFGDWKIQPRMLRNVEARDLSTELFGMKLPAPLMLSPVGVLELAHKKADLAVAEACKNTGVPMIFSNQASVEMEKTAGAMGDSPRLFQLYWSRSNDLVASLVSRAEACGCKGIAVTLDTTMLGWRHQDLDLASLPFLEAKGIAQYYSDPVFQKLIDEPMESPMSGKRSVNLQTIASLLKLCSRYPGSTLGNLRSGRALRAVQTFTAIYSRPSLTWEDIPFLRKHTKLPIILKGILHPEDAKRAVDEGVDGILVSNHGGRQVDGSVSSIEVLPDIAKAVNKQVPVLIDSGIRSGADMFKAIALGADTVCIGRPFVYGLALQGAKGVETVIRNLVADLELNMGLAGCRNLDEIRQSALVHN